MPPIKVSDVRTQIIINEEDLAELDVEIDPFVTHRRPVFGLNNFLHVDTHRGGHEHSHRRSNSKLRGQDDSQSSIASKMSFGARRKLSPLISNLSLNSDIKS